MVVLSTDGTGAGVVVLDGLEAGYGKKKKTIRSCVAIVVRAVCMATRSARMMVRVLLFPQHLCGW